MGLVKALMHRAVQAANVPLHVPSSDCISFMFIQVMPWDKSQPIAGRFKFKYLQQSFFVHGKRGRDSDSSDKESINKKTPESRE